jgi:NAD-dependent SIR2 family protein deacetylase
MRAQHWKCTTGCGHEFYWILDQPRKKRPNCPNCHSFRRMEAYGMIELKISQRSVNVEMVLNNAKSKQDDDLVRH